MQSEGLSFEVLGSKQTLVSKAQAAKDAAKALSKNSTKTYSPLYVLDSGTPAAGQLTVGSAFMHVNGTIAWPVSASHATAQYVAGGDYNSRQALQQVTPGSEVANCYRQGGKTSRPSSAPAQRSVVGSPVVVKIGFDGQNLGPNGLAWQAQPIAAVANASSNNLNRDLALEPLASAMSPLHRAAFQRDPAQELRRSGSWLTSGTRPTSAGSLSVGRSVSLTSATKSAWASDTSDQPGVDRQVQAGGTASADCATDVACLRADQLLNSMFRNLNPSKPDCSLALKSMGKSCTDTSKKGISDWQIQAQPSGLLTRVDANPLTPRTAAFQLQTAKQSTCSNPVTGGDLSSVISAVSVGFDQQRSSNSSSASSKTHTGTGRPGTPMIKQAITNTAAAVRTDKSHSNNMNGSQQLIIDIKTPGKNKATGFVSPTSGRKHKTQRTPKNERASKAKPASSPEIKDVGSKDLGQEQQLASTVQDLKPTHRRQRSKGSKTTSLLSSALLAESRECSCEPVASQVGPACQVLSSLTQAPSSNLGISSTDQQTGLLGSSHHKYAVVPQQGSQRLCLKPQLSLQYAINQGSVQEQQQPSQSSIDSACGSQPTSFSISHDNQTKESGHSLDSNSQQQPQPASSLSVPTSLLSVQHKETDVDRHKLAESVLTSNQNDVGCISTTMAVAAAATTCRRPQNLTLDMTEVGGGFGESSAKLLGPVYRHIIQAGPTENINISPVKLICSTNRARPVAVDALHGTSSQQHPGVLQASQEGMSSCYQIPEGSLTDLLKNLPGGNSLPHSSTLVMDDLLLDAASLMSQFGLNVLQFLEQ